ncbi:alpha-(1,3)-fucosyltransferase 7 [Tachysurus vachellii]|uniref:alpha-(1,3)-fucosyltransferase 7 n=1 Tax=Tachysurus vachellii TaxID=175792 RepID=UPI00296ABD6A|nr:alpha-(1,3)-fucosyltransferase 7 [Tachysurus vachellii]
MHCVDQHSEPHAASSQRNPPTGPGMLLNTRFNKKHLLLVLVLCCILMSLQKMLMFPLLGTEMKTNITILLWYWPFQVPYRLEDDVCLKYYSISGCRLVDDRTLFSTADIVVYHHYELKVGSQKLPLHLPRPVHQRWLWLSLEAPIHNGDVSQYARLFNLTMSYHPDADIVVPYGKIDEKVGGTDGTFVMPENKIHLACWVVSNYGNHHKRTSVYKQLSKLVSVQVYGRAARKPVSQSALLPTISRCYFYLAFENTESAHYITEKLWRNAFMAGTVPVVLGPPRSHYEAVAPPHSFIHVDDFDSIASLAKFLTELAGNVKLYKSYFSWHEKYTVKLYTDWRERLCNICRDYDKLPYHKMYHKLGA